MIKKTGSFIKTLLTVSSLVLLVQHLQAQTPDSVAHKHMAERVKNLYNKKQFSNVYALTSDYFQKSIPEKEFVDFLNDGIYVNFGEMTGHTYLGEETTFHSFVTNFKNGRLKMNMQLNQEDTIAFLQFLPHQEKSVTKVLDFLSDNKKQNALDSLVDAVLLKFIQSPQNCGISIGIQYEGNRYFYNYGETSRGNKTLASRTTIYEIGSVTKTFCGILLAMAANEKKN